MIDLAPLQAAPAEPVTVKCLIVDDLAENLLALAALLAEPGVEVLQARSGAEALELLLRHSFALAFLDVQMPEMDGFELAELMRGSERTRHVPIIFVTAGHGDERRVFKGYDSGAVDFLHKPIEPQVLRSKARVFFQLHRQQLQLADDLRQRTETLRLNELFSAMLGHDLRGPLSAIVMATMVIEKQSPDEMLRRLASRAHASARTMGRMIEDMLDLARGRLGGGIPIRRVACDLAPAVDHTVDEAWISSPERRIESGRDGSLAGEWDLDRITQVASNLVGNALRHGAPDRPVRVHLDGSGADEVVFTVANDGLIPAELLPSIFDPFRGRADLAGRTGGLGIGLFIVRQIVASHGGRVDVRSNPEEGTVFSVTLARRPPLPPAPAARPDFP